MSDWQQPELDEKPEQEAVPQEESPFWDYKDLGIFAASALPALVVAALVVKALFYGFSLPGQGQTPELLAAQFCGYAFWFLSLYLILREKYGRPFWQSLGWVHPLERLWQRAGSGVLLAFCVAVAALFLQSPQTDMPIMRLLSDRLSIILVGLSAATLGPLCEELVFRGFLLPLLVRSLGGPLGVLVAALPFALLHGPQYGWSWHHLVFIVIAGTAFGWVRYQSGSTAASTIMHATYNMTFFAAFLYHGQDAALK